MEILEFLDAQSLAKGGPVARQGSANAMSRELSKAADTAAKKIRASFGLIEAENRQAPAKAKLKKRRKKKTD